ncbi:nucleoside-diphosphate-sugar epimerase [Micromonospora sp. ATCC 39149]|uniref:NAD-dependent epimerase/dehydratase family protein n=1 Tax=Micromonospora carbonacea TaxID=47853 RepID=A0A7D8FV37_9ACTN|nr:nucleoside-diphosphate-sugar epimerase [Micromonospora sp. ATCC 39149]QMV28500.1 NAD-dependent epimerase/dehydratase family protein [Micromonospora carbonacea]
MQLRRPAAVVGATGFIGSRLVSRLAEAGHPVARFSRAAPPVVDGRPAPGLREAQVVYFLAARLSPALAEQQPERVVRERELLLDVLSALAGVDHRPVFVLASSGGAVYTPTVWPPYHERSATGPASAYGRAKLRLEQELLRHTDRVQPVVTRLSNVYGPGQRPTPGYGVLSHWLEATVRGEPIRLFGDPAVVRDYVHVDDVTAIMEVIAQRAGDGDRDRLPTVVNVGSGLPTSLAELLQTMSTVAGRELEVIRDVRRQFDHRGNWLDTTLARETLGWQARISLPDGVRQCWEAVLTRAGGPGGSPARPSARLGRASRGREPPQPRPSQQFVAQPGGGRRGVAEGQWQGEPGFRGRTVPVPFLAQAGPCLVPSGLAPPLPVRPPQQVPGGQPARVDVMGDRVVREQLLAGAGGLHGADEGGVLP